MGKAKMKNRLICLFRILYDETDENNQMSTGELLERLNDCGLHADRKTLRNDIDLFIDNGIDIVVVKSSPNRYFWGDRLFQLPELKLLIDAVSSSRFITAKKSSELIGKLTSLASMYQAEALDRHIFAANRVKSLNENVYYVVDIINDAINENKKMRFLYFEYTAEKKRVYRNNGEEYTLSPYALYWSDDFYYVVGYCDKHRNVSQFRVDRMCSPIIIDADAVPQPRDFDVADYSKKIFEMYNGEDVAVELECINSLMKYVIDRFGEDVNTRVSTPETFIAHVTVCLSPTFYSWVFQFGGKVRILSPKKARREYIGMIEDIHKTF